MRFSALSAFLAVCLMAVFANASDVIVLTDKDFGNINAKDRWFIEFYAPWCGHCKKLAPAWEELATELKGEGIKVAKVDGTVEKSSKTAFGIKGFPSLYLVQDGKMTKYAGARTVQDLAKFARAGNSGSATAIPNLKDIAEGKVAPPEPPKEEKKEPVRTGPSDVVELTDANFEDKTQASTGATTGKWFVEFYAPWCGHCKKLAPVWEEVATALKGEINVAKVDCDANTATRNRFGIRGFPTLYMIDNGKMYKYQGARTKEALSAFAKGGYEKAASEEVPGGLGVVGKGEAFVEGWIRNVSNLIKQDPWGVIVIFGVGALFGVMTSLGLTTALMPNPEQLRAEAARDAAKSKKSK
eukprot:Clim_evm131s210 gene=Clim_evmTU131s210